MSGTLKTIGVISILGLGYYLYTQVRDRVGFKIKGYGIPEWDGTSRVNLPIRILFRNPTQVRLDVERVVVTVYLWKEDHWAPVANIDRPVSIQPGDQIIEIKPTIQLAAILSDILSTVVNASKTKKIFTRTDVTATYAGITFPTQTYEDEIDLV